MSFPFEEPTMLAPMEGVTHPELRRILGELGGIGVLCTEFVRISSAPMPPRHLEKQVEKVPGIPLSVQVMGNDADRLAEAAAIMADAGADIIDLNLGCPMPRIVRKGVGAAMLKDLDLLERVVTEMRAGVPGLLSAKIRAGFDDAEHVVSIAKVVERSGADLLIVHPRRRCDFYEGVADWRIIRTLKEALSISVVGNGDAWYAADLERMRLETGCDAVMCGRPLLRNPFLFAQARALRLGERPIDPSGADLMDFLETMRRRYDVAFAGRNTLGKLKEVLRYMLRAVADDGVILRAALRTSSIEELFPLLESGLGRRTNEELDLDSHGKLGLMKSGSALTRAAAA